ncbi:Error-prone DNA polymerase [Trichinella spiralis]|uniref:Error-prone DNA polymerase n=1 Tax=Trichinella spiralis TaxID=6334 RepID=A0ABR3KDY3_TRISP
MQFVSKYEWICIVQLFPQWKEKKNLNTLRPRVNRVWKICIASNKHSSIALKVFTVVALALSQQSTMFGYLEKRNAVEKE